MDNDDLPVGRVLSRREMLKLLASVSAAAAASACALRLSGQSGATAVPAATAGYGLMIYAIARAKTAADEAAMVKMPQAAVVASGD